MRSLSLRTGSSGPLVRDLQILLNNRLNPSPNLKTNGFFSAQTEVALQTFQNCLWLEPDGIAGPSTLDGLYETEIHNPILHNVPYISQLTPALRWAAATAMLTNSTPQYVRRLTPPTLLTSSGGLNASVNREERNALYAAFARAHQLTYLTPQSWSVEALIRLLKNGPIMAEFALPSADLRRANAAWQYLVIVGARGSHEADGRTTTLRLHDPDDSHGRGIQSLLYSTLQRRAHFGAIGLFTR
jgi:peptidoglycan hydrolase-like protein with peptidoglycan-binding domain